MFIQLLLFQGCLDHEFHCNGTCVDKLLVVCDTKVDCQDQSDEQNCGKISFNFLTQI